MHDQILINILAVSSSRVRWRELKVKIINQNEISEQLFLLKDGYVGQGSDLIGSSIKIKLLYDDGFSNKFLFHGIDLQKLKNNKSILYEIENIFENSTNLNIKTNEISFVGVGQKIGNVLACDIII